MRTLKGKEITRFVRRFPFIADLIDTKSAIERQEQFMLKAQVSVADGEALYIKPHFCLSPHWIGSSDNKYVGHIRPSAYAIDRKGNIFPHTVEWGYDNPDSFLKDVISDKQNTQTIVLIVEYTWWHNVEDWLEKGMKDYCGDFSHYEYIVHIYKRPAQGFDKLINNANLASNVRINDLLSLSMVAYHDRTEAVDAMTELNGLVSQFESTVAQDAWRQIKKQGAGGMSGTYGNTELRVFTTAGRVMLSFWSGVDQVTFIGDESDYARTGLQSMDCSVDTARRLVGDVTNNWTHTKLHQNDNVWFG